jgi:hypothetical protein
MGEAAGCLVGQHVRLSSAPDDEVVGFRRTDLRMSVKHLRANNGSRIHASYTLRRFVRCSSLLDILAQEYSPMQYSTFMLRRMSLAPTCW